MRSSIFLIVLLVVSLTPISQVQAQWDLIDQDGPHQNDIYYTKRDPIAPGNFNVGIGTQTPTARLEVQGDIKLAPSGETFSEYLAFQQHPNRDAIIWIPRNGSIQFKSGATGPTGDRISFRSNGSIVVLGNVVHSSDRRLKDKIRTIPDALAEIASLRGVSFEWQDRPKEGSQFGVIGQEVERVFPELVATDAAGMKEVNYTGLIAPLIEAVKELKAGNEQLKALVCLDHPDALICQ